jgi:hypothetical protein
MTETQLQDRSSTSASPPRYFWVGMAVFMIVLVLVGFWPSYFASLFLGQEPVKFAMMEISPAIHLHAAVFSGWILLLLTQTILAAKGSIRAHMAVGRWGMLLGIGLLAVGGLIMYLKYRLLVAEGHATWTEAPVFVWTMPGWINLLQFAILLTIGLMYRTSPQIHKRFMIFTGLAIISAATDRMGFLGEWRIIMPAVVVSPVWAYDLRTESRIRPATLIGSLIVVSTSVHFLLR